MEEPGFQIFGQSRWQEVTQNSDQQPKAEKQKHLKTKKFTSQVENVLLKANTKENNSIKMFVFQDFHLL